MAPHNSTTTRVALDIDLDHPVLLLITVSVHFCPSCRHYFRAQPPFLRPGRVLDRPELNKIRILIRER
jgi:hypothetical protein